MITKQVLQLARRQHGVVRRNQLLNEIGVSSSQISRALTAERLVPILPGVYLVPPAPDSFDARCWALQLHSRGEGFLSGWTAGRLYGLRRMPEFPIHMTVPHRFTRACPSWVEMHRTSWYSEDHDRVTMHNGLIVARPLRMLFGLAAAFRQNRFEGAAEDAWHLKIATPDAALIYLEQRRCRGKDGVSTFERWLERALDQERPAQSYLERDLITALDQVGLPEPVRQHPLDLPAGNRVHIDIAWPDIRLGVEPGHSWWHGGDTAQERDYRRDMACGEVGWQIQRVNESARTDLLGLARRIRTIHRQRSLDIPTHRRGTLAQPPPPGPPPRK